MHDHHDHSEPTHTAKCDVCEYIAETHAHDEEGAAELLANNLALHNKVEHNQDTKPEDIKDAVKAKMQKP